MRATLPGILLAAALCASAGADHCETYSTSEPELTLDGAGLAPTRYVDYDHCPHEGCVMGIWLYEESNGLPGLQRADDSIDDTCHGNVRGDTIIF